MIRYSFVQNVGLFWLVGNVVLSLVAGLLLARLFERSHEGDRRYFAITLAALTALKMLVAMSHINLAYPNNSAWLLTILSAAAVFYLVDKSLLSNKLPDLAAFPREIVSVLSYVTRRIINFDLRTVYSSAATAPAIQVQKRKKPVRGRLVLWLFVAVLAPIILLVFLEALMQLAGITGLPRWLRSLGIVTAIQGQVMLIAFASIIITIALVVYAISSLFDLLARGGE